MEQQRGKEGGSWSTRGAGSFTKGKPPQEHLGIKSVRPPRGCGGSPGRARGKGGASVWMADGEADVINNSPRFSWTERDKWSKTKGTEKTEGRSVVCTLEEMLFLE